MRLFTKLNIYFKQFKSLLADMLFWWVSSRKFPKSTHYLSSIQQFKNHLADIPVPKSNTLHEGLHAFFCVSEVQLTTPLSQWYMFWTSIIGKNETYPKLPNTNKSNRLQNNYTKASKHTKIITLNTDFVVIYAELKYIEDRVVSIISGTGAAICTAVVVWSNCRLEY
jgi:hypothetical protein